MSRAKYYPMIELEYNKTLFGALESNYPDLYKKPIRDTNVSEISSVEVDLLDCLKSLWGENILDNRDKIYYLVSGKIPEEELILSGLSSDEYYKNLLRSYYKRYSAFRNYVDIEIFFGDKEKPLISRLMKPIRAKIESRYISVINAVSNKPKAKVLMRSHDYVYISFRDTTVNDSYFSGCRVIKNV